MTQETGERVLLQMGCALLLLFGSFASFAARDLPRHAPDHGDAKLAIAAPEQFAWNLFIAVNWPALDGQRGMPNQKQGFGRQTTAVWETWKDTTEVFLSGGNKPSGWDARESPQEDWAKTRLRLSDGIILSSSADPSFVTGGLRDVNKAPIYSEIRMNRIAFDYIVDRELYNVEGQLSYLAANQNLKMPFGSIEVKASWRILDPVKDRSIANRYFHAQAVLVGADGKSKRVKLGLTGMNIMVKVLDNWFWTAFEQVDNPAQTYNIGFPEVMLAVRVDEAMQAVNRSWRAKLAGTPWEHYRSNGAQINFVNSDGTPTYLTNTQQETDILKTSSCIGCHAYSALGRVAGIPTRLFPLRTAHDDGTGTGYLGIPNQQYLKNYVTLDYMWSFIEASAKRADDNPQFLMVNGEKPPRR